MIPILKRSSLAAICIGSLVNPATTFRIANYLKTSKGLFASSPINSIGTQVRYFVQTKDENDENEYYKLKEDYKNQHSLFLGAIPFAATDEIIENSIKSKIGDLPYKSFVLMKNRSGKSRGFGYLNFDNEEQMQEALKKLEGSLILDWKVTVLVSKKLEPKDIEFPNLKSLYISKLHPNTTQEMLFDLCNEYVEADSLASATIINDKTTGKCFYLIIFPQ